MYLENACIFMTEKSMTPIPELQSKPSLVKKTRMMTVQFWAEFISLIRCLMGLQCECSAQLRRNDWPESLSYSNLSSLSAAKISVLDPEQCTAALVSKFSINILIEHRAGVNYSAFLTYCSRQQGSQKNIIQSSADPSPEQNEFQLNRIINLCPYE